MVTNTNFLLTISIPCQEIRLWELMKWSLKRKCFDLLSNSLNLFFKEMYRDQFGELVCGYCGLLVWKKQNCCHPVVTIWKFMVFFPHRFVFVVVKTLALERLLFLLLVPERVDVGTPAALCARFVTISWWTWFTSTRMEASTAADTTLRCSSPAALLVMRWENLMSMLLFDRLCCFLVVLRTVAITKWRAAVKQMIEKTLNTTPTIYL